MQMTDITSVYRIPVNELRISRSSSYLLTAAFFLQDQLTLEIPKFHESIWQELRYLRSKLHEPDSRLIQKVFTVPRDHNKTTLIKLFCVDSLRFDSAISFVLYCSATFSSAANACRDIVKWLLSDEENAMWGKGQEIKKNETEGLWILRIQAADGKMKEIIIKAVGVDKQVRGLNVYSKRPELIVADDIEDLNTADGDRQQRKLDEWFFGTLLKASAMRALVIVIGNIIRNSTLLARICQDTAWNPTNFGAIVKDEEGNLQPLWPHKHTLEGLMNEYRSYRKLGLGHIWESEMMNLSRDISLAEAIPQSCVVPDPHPEQVTCGFIVIDPAFGISAANDETAITVHAQISNSQIPVMIDSVKGRWKERQTFEQILDLVYAWGLTTIVIEAVAAQRLLIPLFKAFMMEQQISEDALLFLPITGQREANAKAARINAFRNACITGNYAIAEGQFEFKLNLEEWSAESNKHDDLPDSASFGPLIWEKMGSRIETIGRRVGVIGALLGRGAGMSGTALDEFATAGM